MIRIDIEMNKEKFSNENLYNIISSIEWQLTEVIFINKFQND